MAPEAQHAILNVAVPHVFPDLEKADIVWGHPSMSMR
jgi:hypothetical protein